MNETVRINLSKTDNVEMGDETLNGWSAGLGRPKKSKDGKTSITMTESVIHPTKQKAWESIEKQVGKLDFDKEEVVFNQTKVSSLQEVKDALEALE